MESLCLLFWEKAQTKTWLAGPKDLFLKFKTPLSFFKYDVISRSTKTYESLSINTASTDR